MKLGLVINDADEISTEEKTLVTLLVDVLGRLLKDIHHEVAYSLSINVEKDHDRSLYDPAKGYYPIRFHVSALNFDKKEVFGKTLWVYIHPVDKTFFFNYEGQKICSKMSDVVAQVVDHIVGWLTA